MGTYGDSISIEIVTGGFILTYPILNKDDTFSSGTVREVFATSRKLYHKLKDVIDTLSLVPEEKTT